MLHYQLETNTILYFVQCHAVLRNVVCKIEGILSLIAFKIINITQFSFSKYLKPLEKGKY